MLASCSTLAYEYSTSAQNENANINYSFNLEHIDIAALFKIK